MATQQQDTKEAMDTAPQPVRTNSSQEPHPIEETVKRPWWYSIKEPGSALQIICAAILAIAIGIVVATQAESIPPAVPVIISIPGDLWLRALKAVGTLTHLSIWKLLVATRTPVNP